MGAVEYFLQIDGIEGESTDPRHKGEIEVLSFSWGESQTAAAAGGAGRGAGRVSMQDLHFTARTSKASPKLMLACATGELIKNAVLACRRAGQGEDFLKIAMTGLLVSSYQISGNQSTDPAPVDEVGLRFAKITFEYRQEGPGGTLGTPLHAGWDLTTGTPA